MSELTLSAGQNTVRNDRRRQLCSPKADVRLVLVRRVANDANPLTVGLCTGELNRWADTSLHMKKLWITYSWADNEDQDVDFVARELSDVGIDVKLDRWTLRTGARLWDQIQEFISSEEQCDGWLLVATENSLASEPCREEFAYALDRALNKRGKVFPVIALFPRRVDDELVPPAIKVRLHVSLTDPDWKERIKSALEQRDPNVTR